MVFGTQLINSIIGANISRKNLNHETKIIFYDKRFTLHDI